MTDQTQREVGWLITKEINELEGIPSRVGWGQLHVHASETEYSYSHIVGRTLFMDTSLTGHMIPDDEQIRWISASDDGDLSYEGVVRISWLFESDDDDDLAYNIDRFCMEETGDTHVWYSVDDIIICAINLGNVAWAEFAANHPGPTQIVGYSGMWIQVYA